MLQFRLLAQHVLAKLDLIVSQVQIFDRGGQLSFKTIVSDDEILLIG